MIANDIGAETLVTLHLETVPSGTRLTLTHTRFAGALPGAEGRHAAGWTNALKALQTQLCGPPRGYDWSAFQITRHIAAPLPDVFRLWSTPSGLRRFWADTVTGVAPDGIVREDGDMFQSGDRISLIFPTRASTELEIINIENDRFVTFTFGRDYGWVRVALAPTGDRTSVTLRQFGLPIAGEAPWEIHANARGWWIFNLMNLESVLLHDHDLRMRAVGAENALGARYLAGEGTAREPHDWTSFDVHLYIEAQPNDVLSRWRTASGIASFFVHEACFTDASGAKRPPSVLVEAGDAYQWDGIHKFRMTGSIVESSPDRMAFTFGTSYEVSVTAKAHGTGTLLHLRQSGMRDEPEDRVQGSLNCRSCWIYFLTALKGQMERGVDLRDQRPETADSISVGYNLAR